jgi:predicted nucleic acid-binding Zn ribbon protein
MSLLYKLTLTLYNIVYSIFLILLKNFSHRFLMSESNESFPLDENKTMKTCYNCGIQIIDANQKFCDNCDSILNPNDLKWRNSFISFLCLLCLIPILIAIISVLISNF